MVKEKETLSKGVVIGIVLVSVLVVVFISVGSIGFLSAQKNVEEQVVHEGSVVMTYTDDLNRFALTSATPTIDDIGMRLDGADQYFDFTVDTSMKDSDIVYYEIAVVKEESSSTILDKNIRIYLEKQESGSYVQLTEPSEYVGVSKKTDIGTPEGAMVLAKVKKTESGSDNYRLRMWLDSTAEVTPDVLQNYTVKVNIYGKAES